jgi:hypothetical protein
LPSNGIKDAGSRKDFSQPAAIAQVSRKGRQKSDQTAAGPRKMNDEHNPIDHSDYFADRGVADLAL